MALLLLIIICKLNLILTLRPFFIPSAVRVGRYSKKQKMKNLAEIQSLATPEQIVERERKDREIYALIQKVVNAHDVTSSKMTTTAHVSRVLCIISRNTLVQINRQIVYNGISTNLSS